MSKFCVFCLVVIFCPQMSSSQGWSHIFDHTEGYSGNIGGLYTFPSRSNLGGYLHADFGSPPGFGVGVRGRYQRGRFNIGADLDARFRSRRPPSYGLEFKAGAHLGGGWHLGASLDTRFQSGNRPDIGGGLTFTNNFGNRRRRSISCMTRCVHACKHLSKVCHKNCIVTMC